jgi:ATP-dependent Lon protease
MSKREGVDVLAVLPTRDGVALPGLVFPLSVAPSEEGSPSFQAANFSLNGTKELFFALELEDEKSKSKSNTQERVNAQERVNDGEMPQTHSIGTIAKIVQSVRLPNGELRLRISVEGRARALSFDSEKGFLTAEVEKLPEKGKTELTEAEETVVLGAKDKLTALLQFDPQIEDHVYAASEIYDPGELADLIGSVLPLETYQAQAMLEEFDGMKRLDLVSQLLNAQIDGLTVRERASQLAHSELSKAQQQEILREQIRVIRAELGEESDVDEELEDLNSQLAKAKLPAGVKKEAERQLRRLQQLHPDTSEAALARTYIDWILDLPWSKRSKDRIDLEQAKTILDEDHHGLDKTKDRILDFLAVAKLKKKLQGSVLLFVGPPGVGKTSLGRSIAKSLGREFFRISLGGLRDEAELRGHRRTYVGALPGRIIQGLKGAGTRNPVILLDEIDKIGSDFRGDPASVLLEILDPEQNKDFEDHYLNVPFDISEVMFIGTANVTDTIPSALLDRMETIELSGYTTQEKLEISKRYLIPRAKEENGLKKDTVALSAEILSEVIEGYTRESGVRELNRMISTLYRKVARMHADKTKIPKSFNSKIIEELLGTRKYIHENKKTRDEIGTVTGLAWTSAGGELLTMETSLTPGKGVLSLTGQLGDVMRESAQAALTYVQANADKLGIPISLFETNNVHIHLPQGAIPKDGPSAGIAMATALVSLYTKKPISREIAMTGEMTLRGHVIAIGGLREKALAALRAGIPKVLYPKENERELREFPDYLLKRVKFIPVENIDQVLKEALVSVKIAADKKPSGPKLKTPIKLPRSRAVKVK